MLCIGIISDTHGLLRAEAVEALRGCDHIIHAGDIGNADILRALSDIAPLDAVRGNNDMGDWAEPLPEAKRLQFEDINVYIIHDLKELGITPKDAGIAVVVSGHSHKPAIEVREGIIYLNPGSAGPRRFKLPVTVAELIIDGQSVTPRIIRLGEEQP